LTFQLLGPPPHFFRLGSLPIGHCAFVHYFPSVY
jgi:hypothetical protein